MQLGSFIIETYTQVFVIMHNAPVYRLLIYIRIFPFRYIYPYFLLNQLKQQVEAASPNVKCTVFYDIGCKFKAYLQVPTVVIVFLATLCMQQCFRKKQKLQGKLKTCLIITDFMSQCFMLMAII